tara:strand:+ start:3313 stop:3711 length:399 start_codon:yes stop_codon:yes gene_type:complete
MPSRSKQKGNRFEREVVNIAKQNNVEAERAYASNGLSLGHAEEVDVVLIGKDKEWRVQCKVRKNIAQWIKPNPNTVDVQVVKEDRGTIYAILPFDEFLELIHDDTEDFKSEEKAMIESERMADIGRRIDEGI